MKVTIHPLSTHFENPSLKKSWFLQVLTQKKGDTENLDSADPMFTMGSAEQYLNWIKN